MTECNRCIALRTELNRERGDNASLHSLLLDIREAAGDPHGRMMLTELVETIGKQRRGDETMTTETAKDRRAREAIEVLTQQLADVRGDRDALSAHMDRLYAAAFEADKHKGAR